MGIEYRKLVMDAHTMAQGFLDKPQITQIALFHILIVLFKVQSLTLISILVDR
jgi:hypothetical protein